MADQLCLSLWSSVWCVCMSGLDGLGLGGEASDALMDEVAQGDFGTIRDTLYCGIAVDRSVGDAPTGS